MKGNDLPGVFSRNLKTIREFRGLSQRALADKLQMSPVGVNRWENGLTSPTLNTIARIAEALDIPSEALLSEVGTQILMPATA